MSNNWKVLIQFHYTLYTIICTHTELLNDTDNIVVISCYGIMFKPYFKKNLFGEEDRHTMFVISSIASYFYGLMKTLSVSGKSLNAISLGVECVWNLMSHGDAREGK